ncbi:MAG: DUF885 family protein [Proteobacteria bacterium]|nr:DUF885 family protein [Pseudomonadota bacterium]
MLHRRQILKSGVAAAALGALATPTLARAAGTATAPANPSGAALNKLFDQFMTENLDLSPIGATFLGVDTGARAKQRGEIDDNSLAGYQKQKDLTASQLQRLNAFDSKPLTGMDELNYEIIQYGLQIQDGDDKKYNYGGQGAGAPYIVSQLTGTYQQFPDFLASQQPVETKDDAEYYLQRLDGVALALDRDSEAVRHDVALGVIPPDFALDKALTQMAALRGVDAGKSVMVEALVTKAKAKNIPGDWQARATKIVSDKLYPALDRQIALAKDMRSKAVHDAGVWRLPQGEAYYADSVIAATTTNMTPEEIHKTGLEVVADYTARIDADMKKLGLTKGTVGERLRGMYNDPKFRYPNTDEGKEKLLADLNVKIQKIRARLPEYYGVLPKADLQIKRVPKATEAGAPGGYYNPGSLDGKRPGMYYINLRDTAEVPSWTLSTLSYHEGIPGHHMQLSIQQETDLPLIRKVSGFTAYIEGWALYSEQMADEMGMYADDPWGRIGYMHDAMFRGVRLVVDSGMHAMKWSREKAIKYYTDTLGDLDASAITEVERYCVWPGQACAYMVGKLDFLKQRAKAKAALGAKFDIRQFHKAVLVCGAVPLAILDKVVDRYIAETKAG